MSSFPSRMTAAPQTLAPCLLVLLLLSLTPGCATRGLAPPPLPASSLWQSFELRRDAAGQALMGLKASASLHYEDKQKQNRIMLLLWGSPTLPLRLDLSAGFGTTFAMVSETETGWSGYLPEKNIVYQSRDAQLGQNVLGIELPFTLRELAGVAAGTYTGLAPVEFIKARPAPNGGWSYTFKSGSPVTSLTLDGEGKPVVFAGRLKGRDWTMTLSQHGQDAASAPETITIRLGKVISAVLRIKRLERMSTPWPDESLALKLPPGTVVSILDL
ncbi:MAG: hypothetical protein KKE73_01960 [Proteobacteria bacterium]|nr:hypothetical protein [Pseudomonadota bacterium]